MLGIKRALLPPPLRYAPSFSYSDKTPALSSLVDCSSIELGSCGRISFVVSLDHGIFYQVFHFFFFVFG